MSEYTPCPTCHQYSHSIGEDRVTAAFNHFQAMSAMPIQNAFGEQTRDYAQVLVAEITRLRADRNAVIRECAEVAMNVADTERKLADEYAGQDSQYRATMADGRATICDDLAKEFLALIEEDE